MHNYRFLNKTIINNMLSYYGYTKKYIIRKSIPKHLLHNLLLIKKYAFYRIPINY